MFMCVSSKMGKRESSQQDRVCSVRNHALGMVFAKCVEESREGLKKYPRSQVKS